MLHHKHKNTVKKHASIQSPDLNLIMPKHQMPQQEHDPQQVYRLITNELLLDGNASQNLATFCSTWEDPEIHSLLDISIGKNMIDKDEYPQTAEIEARCVHILADLWHSPEASSTLGTSTTGSSEAAMLGGLALKWRWRKNQEKKGKDTSRPNLVTGPVQVCWHKFARYFDVELREIAMEKDEYMATPEKWLRRCDENTIGVVATLGTTFTGQYEPIEALSQALDQLEKESGLNIPIHVDAASGGFVAPFIQKELTWDFRLPRVHSINASGHKFGLAPLGVGWIVWREAAYLPEELIFRVNYLGGEMPTFALNFSRPAGQVIAQYYQFLRLGHEGYQRIMQNLQAIASDIASQIEQIGPFTVLHHGQEGLPVVAWILSPEAKVSFNLFDLTNQLRTRGWQVPAYTLLPNIEDTTVARIVVRYGFDNNLADLFITDLKHSIAYFKDHPVTSSLQADEAQGFNHL